MKTVKKFVIVIAMLLLVGGVAIGENRSIDGTGNNLTNHFWGSVGTTLQRIDGYDYSDGISAPGGAYRPTPRLVSSLLMSQEGSIPNILGRSDYLWAWGQFIDHDIGITTVADPVEAFDIVIMPGDPVFDPNGDGGVTLAFDRSIYDPNSGTSESNHREQLNMITSWMDGSMVYGSDDGRAGWLREGVGGRLKVTAHSTGYLLPYNDGTMPNAGGPGTDLFVAGDIRANEHVVLTSLHTLFVREHNRLAAEISAAHPGWSDEQIYQKARKMVGAEIQAITYKEFLPALFGNGGLSEYTGYKPGVNPSISNTFSTAAYRFGHSAVSPLILRLGSNHQEIPYGHLQLDEGFFNPSKITDEGGIEPILRGLTYQLHQKVDIHIIDAFRDNLFATLDLASLNIQRGRDHGIPNYNQVRENFGFEPVSSFAEITPDPVVHSAMEGLYGSVDNIDAWVGMLAEQNENGSMVGPLRNEIFREQFKYLRDGDRFWYAIDPDLSAEELSFIESVRLKDVIEMNTGITGLPENVFYVPEEEIADELVVSRAIALLGYSSRWTVPAFISYGSSFDASGHDMTAAETIEVSVIDKGSGAAMMSESIEFSAGTYSGGKFTYSSNWGKMTYLKLDLVNDSFVVIGEGLDLSGLGSVIELEIKVGDYLGRGSSPVGKW